jgi:putative intracellular protease/amidase
MKTAMMKTIKARITICLFFLSFLLLPACVQAQDHKTQEHKAVHKIKVALFVDTGTDASEFKKEFRRSNDSNITYEVVDGEDIADGVLSNYDAVLIPGGSAKIESRNLGTAGKDEIRRFVKNGGLYMGICAGAYLASMEHKFDLGFLPLTVLDKEHWFRADPENGPKLEVELTPLGMEIFGIDQAYVKIVYENGPIFSSPIEEPDPSFTPLGYFRSEVVADGGTPGVMLSAPAIVLSRYGKGIVLAISPHPEETPGLEQTELHALRWMYNHRNADLKN